MANDILYKSRRRNDNPNLELTDAMYNEALLDIQHILQKEGKTVEEYDLPEPEESKESHESRAAEI